MASEIVPPKFRWFPFEKVYAHGFNTEEVTHLQKDGRTWVDTKTGDRYIKASCKSCSAWVPVNVGRIVPPVSEEKIEECLVKTNTFLKSLNWSVSHSFFFCEKCSKKRQDRLKNSKRIIQGMEEMNTKSQLKTLKNPPVLVSAETPLRTPTREQKRAIISLLEACYDIAAGRYKGSDTDKTIAETIGEGVMPGWVAEIREDLFGPLGQNQEMDILGKDLSIVVERLKAIYTGMEKLQAIAEAHKTQIDKELRGIKALQDRLEAIKKAVGPKAERL